MTARKDNKVYTVSEIEMESYLSMGYDIFDEEHCSWKRAVWTARERGADLNTFYPVRG